MVFNKSYLLQQFQRPSFSIFIILLFHVSGLIGLQTTSMDWFLSLTPLNLLVSFLVLIRHEDFKNSTFILVTSSILFFGFILEVIGVNTGILFGNYIYGKTLGIKLFNTPLIIGFNWFIMVFCVGVIIEKTRFSTFLKSIVGATIMTLADYIIEPVAIAYDFWKWNTIAIPIQNYIAWFSFSFFFMLFFLNSKINKNNEVAPWLFVVQLIFFFTLNLLL